MSETLTREFEKLTRHTPSVSDGFAFMVTDYDHGQWLSRQSVLALVADLQAELALAQEAIQGESTAAEYHFNRAERLARRLRE